MEYLLLPDVVIASTARLPSRMSFGEQALLLVIQELVDLVLAALLMRRDEVDQDGDLVVWSENHSGVTPRK
jgi:hypothetical protein